MGRLRALNGAIACENTTGEHIDPFEVIVISHAAQEPVIHFSEAAPSTLLPLFVKPTCHSTAPRSETYELLVRCSRKYEHRRWAANAVRYKAACAQGLRSADHGSTSSRPRSMKDVATTSMGEGVLRSVILRYLRRRSTPTGPSRMAPERQAACGMAWMVHNERRRLVGGCKEPHDRRALFGGSADEVLFVTPGNPVFTAPQL